MLETLGAMIMSTRCRCGIAAPSAAASARFGYSRKVTSPTITVVMTSLTSTHHHLTRPHGVPTELTTPTIHTR